MSQARQSTGEPSARLGTDPEPDTPFRVLVVEDDPPTRRLVSQFLEENGYLVTVADSGDGGLRLLNEQIFDVVLLDLDLPGMHGLNVLSAAPAVQTDAQFIVLTGYSDASTAVRAMKLGAFDYLTKPVDTDEFLLVLERAVRETELRRELAHLRREVESGTRARIVGKSPALERLFDHIQRVAPTRTSVLITGETGTGKELAARAVHELSPRAHKPFVAVNCAALPETLLEAELFGHLKGAFTGAEATRRGLVEEADGGTLFLDEISNVSPATQVKLLRVLQERTVRRLGGGPTVPVDFRLVAATNVELGEEVEAGRFREDLFYRLNVFPLKVPALRERKSDIPLLAYHFRREFMEENGLEEAPAITPETLTRMMEYPWPGNVRELENFVYRAMILHSGSDSIRFDPDGVGEKLAERDLLDRARAERWDLSRLEKEYILSVLEDLDGNQTQAAEVLGIDRRTLYRKLKQYRDEDGAGEGSR